MKTIFILSWLCVAIFILSWLCVSPGMCPFDPDSVAGNYNWYGLTPFNTEEDCNRHALQTLDDQQADVVWKCEEYHSKD